MLGKHKFIGLSVVLGLFLLWFRDYLSSTSRAANGIEPYLSFEGKIVTSSTGANITDGHYNMEFSHLLPEVLIPVAVLYSRLDRRLVR